VTTDPRGQRARAARVRCARALFGLRNPGWLILCIFPALIVIVVGPGIIELSRTLFHHL